MKKVMVLGGGIYQVPLIKQINSMGYESIVVSIEGSYPGLNIANKSYFIDTRDSSSILKIAKNECIDGVCTSGTDVAIMTLGTLCEELGLIGISKHSAEIASLKVKMKHMFKECNVRTAEFRIVDIVTPIEKIIEICQELLFPVIFKVEDSSGSRGVVKVTNKDEINNALNIVLLNTKSDKFIIEKYIKGVEFGAQGFVLDGELIMYLPHGDYVFKKNNTNVPIGHYIPVELNDEIYYDSKEQTIRAIKACKLDNCPINIDFIFSNNKVYIIELACRSGGTCLPEIVSAYYNRNYYEDIVNLALGKKTFNFKEYLKYPIIAHLITSESEGVIQSFELPSIDIEHKISLDYKVGDFVNKFKVGSDRIGEVILTGNKYYNSYEKLNEYLSGIMKNIKINIKDN